MTEQRTKDLESRGTLVPGDCPFCGSHDTALVDGHVLRAIECRRCLGRGPPQDSEAAAVREAREQLDRAWDGCQKAFPAGAPNECDSAYVFKREQLEEAARA